MSPVAPVTERDDQVVDRTELHRPPASAPTTPPHRLLVHVAVLALVLIGVVLLTKATVTTPDEGTYGSQALALREGSWSYPWRFADLDPDGRWFPIANGTSSERGEFTYAKHPAVPWVQATLVRAMGEPVGLLAPSVGGVLAAAAVAWAVARRVRPGTEAWAFWLVGSGPLLFHTSIIWAHAPAAAFGGLAVFGAVRLQTPARRWIGHLALAAGLAAGILVRSEGLLFALALLGALGLDQLLRPGVDAGDDANGEHPHDDPVGSDHHVSVPTSGRRARSWSWPSQLGRAVQLTAPGLLAVVVTRFAERAWIESIVGAAPNDLEVRTVDPQISWLDGRGRGLWASTLSGSDLPSRSLILPLLLLVVAVVIARRHRLPSAAVPVIVATYALTMAMLSADAPSQLVGGLLPAWALVTIGLVAAGRRSFGPPRILLLACAAYAVALWATVYPDGGAFQWGGRFFTIVAVPLGVLAADGLRRLMHEHGQTTGPPNSRHPATLAALAGLAVVSALSPVAGLRATRASAEPIYAAVDDAIGPVAISTGSELPRLMWRSSSDWLHVPVAELPDALARLQQTGLRTISVISSDTLTPSQVAAFGRITSRTPIPGSALTVLEIVRS